MTRVIRYTSAGERGRLFARRTGTTGRDTQPPEPAGSHGTDTSPDIDAAIAVDPSHGLPAGLLEHLGPAYVANRDGTLIWHNPGLLTLARAAWGVPDSATALDAAPAALREIFDALARSGRHEPERITMPSDGAMRTFRGHHHVRPGSEGFYGVYEDITRLLAAERRYRTLDDKLSDLVRATSDWVWETGPDLRLAEVSARIAAITGRPPNALIGRPLLSLGEAQAPAPNAPDLRQTMDERRPFRNRVFVMRDDTGRTRRIHLSGMPFFDPADGSFLGYRGTGTDVTRTLDAEHHASTAQRRLEQALAQLEQRNAQLHEALDKSQHASDAKSGFLALTSHELRTPLNAIIGFAELSRRQLANDAAERVPGYLDNILAASNHLVQIIDNLLDTVRIENEAVDLDLVEIDPAELVRDTVAMVEVRARQSGLVLHAPAAGDAPAVIADRTAARQILINLLTNAIKFTSEGGSVGVDVAPGKEGLVYITVWDTGVGIPPEHQQAVFDRFHRVRGDGAATSVEGVGIGLHVARNLAQLMGGDIALDSEPGRGSRFTLALRTWDEADAAREA